MFVRRSFFSHLFSLLIAPFVGKKQAGDESRAIRQPGWVAIPEDEYKRLVSASTPIVCTSPVVAQVDFCAKHHDRPDMWERARFHFDEGVQAAIERGFDPDNPHCRIEIRLVERKEYDSQ